MPSACPKNRGNGLLTLAFVPKVRVEALLNSYPRIGQDATSRHGFPSDLGPARNPPCPPLLKGGWGGFQRRVGQKIFLANFQDFSWLSRLRRITSFGNKAQICLAPARKEKVQKKIDFAGYFCYLSTLAARGNKKRGGNDEKSYDDPGNFSDFLAVFRH